MRAVVIDGSSGLESLHVREVPTPEAFADQVRVRVRAAGVNRSDLLQARGMYPAPPGVPADIPGLEFAGEVDAIGPQCTGRWNVGQRVFGIVGGGGMSEFLVVHERMLVEVPDSLTWEEAGAVPEAFVTAYDALTTQARVRPGERVLVHAAAGGVGLAASQLAHAMGCSVVGTSRTPEKRDRLASYGVDLALDTGDPDWVDSARDFTSGHGVDVVVDHLGGPLWAINLCCLATQGRIVVVGLLAGAKAEVDLRSLMDRRATVVGTVLRSRPLEQKIEATRGFAECVIPWLRSGRVKPVVDSTFALADIRDAVQRMQANAVFGKVVVMLGS